ncbi:gliding motility-associated C-terminal domain-containing protein [uncultured Dokdonia sp.]|uniref:HYR-like domain-containing protein n=1 Tax=uncultured Dokdonia sp. TaxID=575653 RepID=UPI0026342207|nr:gliding motility-associated C-terminal domain-containing protein [uncultured Dokdonia sp.]
MKYVLSLLFIILFSGVYGQTVVCEGSPCTSNDFTLDDFYLAGEDGIPFGPGYCEPGDPVNANLWINFTANTAASRYSMYVHFNLYIDGLFVDTIDQCYFENTPIPVNVSLNTYQFSWTCGSEITMEDFYVSWQPNGSRDCDCTNASCYNEEVITVLAPLIANYDFSVNCSGDYTIDFESTTSGGLPPYTYLWDFGDGTTSAEETPTHVFPNSGPFTVSLAVFDAENTDSFEQTIVNFPELIDVSIDDFTNESCPGASDGTATATVSGGEMPYIYSWDTVPVQTTQTATGLSSGVYTVTVTDTNGCVSSDNVIIGIDDTAPPIITAPPNIVIEGCATDDVTGAFPYAVSSTILAEAQFILGGGAVSDDVSIVQIDYIDTLSGTCPLVISRLFTVTDGCGATASDTQLITIQDTTLPTASNLPDIMVSCTADVPMPDIAVVTDAADNCSDVTVTYVNDVSDNATCAEVITRTYVVTDACGNTFDVTQQIIINDEINPTASNPASIEVLCIEDVPLPDVAVVTDAADNCSVPTVNHEGDVSDGNTCGETITRTYSVTDACNNSIAVIQLIVVNDTVDPTASNPAPIEVSCVEDIPTPNIAVVIDEADNCSVPVVAFVEDVSDGNTCGETITRTYSVTDACDNSIVVTQQIIINDTIDPTASNPAPIEVSCIADVPTPNIAVVIDEDDNCSVPVVEFVEDVSDGKTCGETITRTYSVTDACDNSIIVTQQIIINDTIDPTASNPAPIEVSCVGDVPLPDVAVVTDATDNCNVPVVEFIEDVSDGNTCGETIIRTYSVTDACDNSIIVIQQIIINDTINPTASNPAPIEVSCAADIPMPDVTVVTDAADNCSTPVVAFVEDNSDNANCAEVIIRTYSVTDACDNTIIVTQQITINDEVNPTASNPAPIEVSCIEDVPLPDVTVVSDAADNCSAPTVNFESDVSDGNTCGEIITRTYSVTDACNNSIEVTQLIVINDTIDPTASNPAPIIVSCDAGIPSPDGTVVIDALDNCGTPTVSFVSDFSNGTCPQVITRTYRVTDFCGNYVDVEQELIFDDMEAPLLNTPFDETLTVNCNSIPEVPTLDFIDNCSVDLMISFNEEDTNVNGIDDYEITRTWTVADNCGNQSVFTQVISVLNADCSVTNCAFACGGSDTILPTASNPSTTIVGCNDDIPPVDISVVTDANDNCSSPVVAFVSEVISIDCFETVVRTYSITDGCGNFITVEHTISVVDNDLPTASNPPNIEVSCIADVPLVDVNVVVDEADNCGVPTVTFVSEVSNNDCNQNVVRTYRVTDRCGNFINVTQNIVVNDNIDPTASNPALIEVSCIEDVPTPNIAVVIDEADNCSVPFVAFVKDESDGNTCGETITRTYSVTDACNNSIEVTQLIVINDTIDPTASNPAPIEVSCIADVPTPNIAVVIDEADNCSVPVVAFVEDVSDGNTCGETITRTYSVTDACDNSIIVIQQIIINDIIDPTASNPAPIEVSCVADVPVPNIAVVIDEADNCSVPVVEFVEDVSDGNICGETITRTYSVTDACDNSIIVTQQIIINDIINPTASNPAPIQVSCIEDIPVPDATVVTDAADNCSTPVVAFVEDNSDNANCAEVIMRTYSVTDACDNTIIVTQQITINDEVDPTASNPAPIQVACIEDIPMPDVTVVTDAADNCSAPTVNFEGDVSDGNNCGETITRTYSVTDACDNSIEVTQLIIINDEINPTASNPAPIEVSCIADVPTPNIAVVIDEADNCSVPVVAFVEDVSDGNICGETITRTYSVTDACDNSIIVTQQIIINDIIDPTASNPAPIEVSCVADVPVPNIAVVIDEADNCSVPVVEFVEDVSDGNTCGETITRTYSVTDACDNSIIVTQQIIINDIINPTASNPAPIQVSCIEDIPVPDATVVTDAADNCSTPVVAFVEDNSDNANCAEVIMRTYSVTDACDNTIIVTQQITINDEVDPTASNPAPIQVACIEDIPMPDVTVVTDAADNCSAPTVNFEGDVSDGNTCGETITRTYSVTDACDNSIEVTQLIIINDEINPTASNPAPIEVSCASDVPMPDISMVTDAADNCSTPTVSFIEDVSDGNSCGETIERTYLVSDACNNSLVVTQRIIINDTIAPTASDPAFIEVSCAAEVPMPDISVVTDAADNCSAPTVSFIEDVSDGNSCGETIERTYLVSDACNNSLVVTQRIIINDTIQPTASDPALIEVSCAAEIPMPDISVVTDAADNCSAPTVSFIEDVSGGNSCGETIERTYLVSDACNNSLVVTQRIIINDTIAPTASDPALIEVSCAAEVPMPDISVVTDAADNCSAPTVSFIEDVSDGNPCGETIERTYLVSDACNNSLVVTQRIIINDTIAPTASDPALIEVSCAAEVPMPDISVVTDAADNCSTPTVSFIEDVSDGNSCGETIERTYLVSDACNNSKVVTQRIIINDTIAPTASDPDSMEFSCIEEVPVPDISVVTDAADNCSTPTVTFEGDVSDGNTCGETIERTYLVTDACGNFLEVVQLIFVNDEIAPVLISDYEPIVDVLCGDIPSVPELIFEDNCGGKVNVNYSETSDQSANPDNYTIIRTWEVEDLCGNGLVTTQLINVSNEDEIEFSNLSYCIEDTGILLDSLISNTNGTWTIPEEFIIENGAIQPSQTPLGEYSLVYEIISGDCSLTQIFNVSINDDCIVPPDCSSKENVKISKVVTPNFDGANDFFEVALIYQGDCDFSIDVQIFNRWGNLVYEAQNYENNWSGESPNASFGNANRLPSGTYYYIVSLNNSDLSPIQGYIYLGSE